MALDIRSAAIGAHELDDAADQREALREERRHNEAVRAASVRAAAAKIAAESGLDDPMSIKSTMDRDIIGGSSVQVRLPLRDPAQVKHHLQLLIVVATECVALIDRNAMRDRSVLMDVRTRLRWAGKKINCYMRVRPL